MNEYFDGSVEQLLERTRQLCDLIPRNLGRDVAALEVAARDRLDEVGRRLCMLRDMPEMREKKNQLERLREFRRLRSDIDHLESVAITALYRWKEQDVVASHIADIVCHEIRFPLPTPVISCVSQRYFHTYPHLRLICIPLAETRFLLHLPDLYHELGHSLLAFENDARLTGLQAKHVQVVNEAIQYLAAELQKERSGLGPKAFTRYLVTWMDCWVSWGIEFFCDLFALYTLGPAFAWSHLHLSASFETDPFRVPLFTTTIHPADAARMRVLLIGLRRLKFADEAAAIEHRWNQFLEITHAKPNPEYHRCFPQQLMAKLEAAAFEGVSALKCKIAQPGEQEKVGGLLNEAWRQFWSSPDSYVGWERAAAAELGLVHSGKRNPANSTSPAMPS